MLAAVAGVHPAIDVREATQDELVIGDLGDCGWPHCDEYAVARVVDNSDNQGLDDFCSGCLGMGAGYWATRRPYGVHVLLPHVETAAA